MPIWCPPTPPSAEGDVYCETWARALYRPGAATDAMLPAPHRREARASRDRRTRPLTRPPPAPLSMFERAGPRPRPRPRPTLAHPPHTHAALYQLDWTPAEDAALRRALRLQRAPAEPPPAIATNWEWVADLVADVARTYRSPRACRDRHDALADPDRARRRHRRPPAARRRNEDERPRPPLSRLEAVRDAAERRRAAPKRRLEEPPPRNPKHAQLLADHGLDYESPPAPQEVAARRADRIAREKLKAATVPTAASVASAVPSSSAGVATSASSSGTPPPPSAACPGPQRVLVAAAKPDARRLRTADTSPATPASASAAGVTATPQLVYRQQSFPTRHLKILHQGIASSAHGTSGVGDSVSGGGNTALHKLHLQQVALRRTAANTASSPSTTSHVVVAHLTPTHTPAPPSTTQHTQQTPPRSHTNNRQ